MFDTPNWMGSFITSRSNKDINELNRKHEVMMEDIKHKHEYLIQESKNRVTENVAKANRESAEEIARLTRVHEAEMQSARNKNAISVALIQAASRTVDTALPLAFPAFMAGRMANSKHNGNNDTNNKSSNSSSPVTATSRTTNKVEVAKKKADDLFPELEPTFGVSLTSNRTKSPHTSVTFPKINVTQLVPALGAVLSVAAPILAIL